MYGIWYTVYGIWHMVYSIQYILIVDEYINHHRVDDMASQKNSAFNKKIEFKDVEIL